MSKLQLQSQKPEGFTLLSHIFIDTYMPRANGEFVKVYLYLLRFLSEPECAFGLSDIADAFDCPESDILRALRYWEKAGLLALSWDGQKKLQSITFISPSEAAGSCKTSEKPAGSSETAAALAKPAAASSPEREELPPPESTLTPDKVKELQEREDIMQLLFIAQQYLGKTLTPTETSRLLYFYDTLHFDPELIEYLIEYCVSRGHKSIRYIEKVALSWHSEGIRTTAMAKEASSTYSRTYFTVLKALGVTNRNPVSGEVATIDRWLGEYGFSMELVLEACQRTVKATGKPSFQYADGILNSWRKKQVKSLEDIRALDLEHLQNQERQAARRARPQTPNRFNNFTQRDYDYSELEKQLLKQ